MTSYLKLSRLLEARTTRSPVVVVVRCMAKQPPPTSKEPSKKCVKTHCIHPEPKTVFMFMTMIYIVRYSHTLFLPRTSFPARVEGKKRTAKDEEIATKCGFDSQYQWQRDNRAPGEWLWL